MRKAWAVVALIPVVAALIPVVAALVRAEPPADYYATAVGKTRDDLKAALHDIIDGHKAWPYPDIWKALAHTDSACPDDRPDCGRVRLLYLGHVRSIHQKRGQGAAKHDAWEREHVWPKSRGFKERRLDGYTDLHHLRPADSNSNRAHSYYGYDVGGQTVMDKTNGGREVPTEAKLDKVNASFEPPDRAKGQVARMLFYMAARYEEDDNRPGEEMPDLYLRDTNRLVSSEPWIGDLCTLVAWNRRFPPTRFERRRNDRVMQWQGNRNPFIDRPVWVDLIWGPRCR